MAFVFKIKYQSGFSFIVLPTFALVSEDLRKDNKIRNFLKVVGSKFTNGYFGRLCSCRSVIAIF